jgi:histidinol dehydrogenase
MNVICWQDLSEIEKNNVLQRPIVSQDKQVLIQTKAIVETVKKQGDSALLDYTQLFDGVGLKSLTCNTQVKSPIDTLSQKAIETAIQTIRTYHQALKPSPVTVMTAPGVCLTKAYQPIDRVGLYVPGGNTPLISSLLMLAIPAQIAGNPMRVVCTPPMSHGELHPMLMEAARLCGIETIYKVGGAQAIAAMAYGTESIPKVDKIFGPGNRYVTAAKSLVAQDSTGPSIDMPAGPSEVMVLADQYANPAFVAADMLSQAEHGPDSQVILVSTNQKLIYSVMESINQQKQTLSRLPIINEALKVSQFILAGNDEAMVTIVNRYAPEHLILNCKNAESIVPKIQSAGTIFVGPWAAESLGDYVTGSNHVLPTYGYAKSMSGLATIDFMKAISIQRVEPCAIMDIGRQARYLAKAEGLNAHDNAITVREEYLCQSNN